MIMMMSDSGSQTPKTLDTAVEPSMTSNRVEILKA